MNLEGTQFPAPKAQMLNTWGLFRERAPRLSSRCPVELGVMSVSRLPPKLTAENNSKYLLPPALRALARAPSLSAVA